MEIPSLSLDSRDALSPGSEAGDVGSDPGGAAGADGEVPELGLVNLHIPVPVNLPTTKVFSPDSEESGFSLRI